MKKRNGFTLLELLVVIAIIIMLVALLAPTLRGAKQNMHDAICKKNLKEIGRAAHLHRASVIRGTKKALVITQWPEQLMPYLGDGRILTCPQAPELSEEQMALEPHREISEFINVKGTHAFVEGPKIVKVSDEQVQQFGGFRECVRITPKPSYVPGPSGIVWWGWEDGSDMDYQDVLVRVTPKPDGTSELECSECTGGRPWVQYVESYKPGGVVAASNADLLAGIILVLPTGGGSASHYGLNEAAMELNDGTQMLGLEYKWIGARSSDRWTDAAFDSDEDDIPDFFRHSQHANVLFTGGSVRAMRQEEIGSRG